MNLETKISKFDLGQFLVGEWQLNKKISYMKLFHELSGNDGIGVFEGVARFIPVRQPLSTDDPDELWYKEDGLLKMGSLSTVNQ
jgi:hypothetical protein